MPMKVRTQRQLNEQQYKKKKQKQKRVSQAEKLQQICDDLLQKQRQELNNIN